MKLRDLLVIQRAAKKASAEKKKSWAMAHLAAGTTLHGPEIVFYNASGAIIGVLHFSSDVMNKDKRLKFLSEIEARL